MRLEGGRLELLIDARNARYPLRVDPFVQQDSHYSQTGEKFTAESTGELGKSVAVSADGSTVLVGAPATSGKVGAAYVFEHTTEGSPRRTVPAEEPHGRR